MYTSKAPPTHQQIQKALVDVGDKEASLVGSKEWIGSFEVSTCLNHLLGVGSLSPILPLPSSILSLSLSPFLSLCLFLSFSHTLMFSKPQHTHSHNTNITHTPTIQVQCKLHHCSSGAEMASVGSMLLSHFQTYGTPIMIGKSYTMSATLRACRGTRIIVSITTHVGGGVLAHTILGVDYNDSTGEIQ